ncbi:hypothetical protein D3C81_2094180 [compost metagenome]
MQLVLEGIETQVQREQLVAIGGKLGQGFLCAKAMPIEVFDDWIHGEYHALLNFPANRVI